MSNGFMIGDRAVGDRHPTYFIADLASNHDGSLDRALELMTLARDSGADCVKFQHFRAEHLVSDFGFRALGARQAHQAAWQKSVFEVYESAEVPWDWTEVLHRHALELGVEFMSTPYDLEAVDHLDPYVNAFKVGSGDITWLEELEAIASKGKPVLLATGASSLDDVETAVAIIRSLHVPLGLLQCNTNYEGSLANLRHLNLRVLLTFQSRFPYAVGGLSDHTPGHLGVLGAVALGGRIIEKHFTDDTTRHGPDHSFSMNPKTWRAMVHDVRLLESALGSGNKVVESNELETLIVQRRCLRAARDLEPGTVLERSDLDALRPAPIGSIAANERQLLIGQLLVKGKAKGDCLYWDDLMN